MELCELAATPACACCVCIFHVIIGFEVRQERNKTRGACWRIRNHQMQSTSLAGADVAKLPTLSIWSKTTRISINHVTCMMDWWDRRPGSYLVVFGGMCSNSFGRMQSEQYLATASLEDETQLRLMIIHLSCAQYVIDDCLEVELVFWSVCSYILAVIALRQVRCDDLVASPNFVNFMNFMKLLHQNSQRLPHVWIQISHST